MFVVQRTNLNPHGLQRKRPQKNNEAAQRYVEEVPAPSVITLNAVACAHTQLTSTFLQPSGYKKRPRRFSG